MLADLRIAQIAQKRVYSVEKDDPQPHVDLAFRFWMLIGSTNRLMPWDSKT